MLPSPSSLRWKKKKEGDNLLRCVVKKEKKRRWQPSSLCCNKKNKKKVTTVLLPLPSSLQQNEQKKRKRKKATMMAGRELTFTTFALGPTSGASEFVGSLQACCSCCNFKRVDFAFAPTPMALVMEWAQILLQQLLFWQWSERKSCSNGSYSGDGVSSKSGRWEGGGRREKF